MEVALDEAPGEELLEPPFERSAVVEGAGDSENLRAVGRGRESRRIARRAEEHRLEPDARAARRECFAEIARRRAAEGFEVECLCCSDGARCDPVLERVRRVGVLQLQQQMDPERL